MAEQAWRPRPCCHANRRSGSPWVPVRPYYEGPPSKEGRYGSDEGRRKPPGSRGMKVPRSGPDERGPGVEDATVERREAACPQGTWAPSTRCHTKTERLSELRPLTLVRGRETRAAPTPTK